MSPAHARTGRARLPHELGAAADAAMVASRTLVGVAARSLAGVEPEVTLPQYRALVLLNSRGALNAGELAEALGSHPSTVTRLCDRLLTKGLIERTTSAASRREVTLSLSRQGRALVRSVTTARRRELRRILERLDPKTSEQLIDAFNAFAAAAREVPDDAWRLGWTQ